MTTAHRGFRTGALRAGAVGFGRDQSAPLVLREQSPQLGTLGRDVADFRAHFMKDSSGQTNVG